MKKFAFRAAACSLALLGMSAAAQADVSIMYPEWLATLVEPGIKNYEAATGVDVESIKLPSDGYDKRIAVDLAAGTAADINVMDGFMVAELASAGYLMALDEPLSSWDQYKYYMPALLKLNAVDGKVYALPTDTDVRMLWYDKALFAKAGIEMPWKPKDWDDILDAATKVKEKTGADYSFALPAGTKMGEATTMQGFYMAMLGADTPEGERNRLRNWKEGKWIGKSPAITRTAELYYKVYVEQELSKPALNYAADKDAALRDALANHEFGILAGGSWDWACLFDCTGVNLPPIEERKKIIGWTPWPGSGFEGAPTTTNVSGGWSVGINAKAENPDQSVALLTTIFDKEAFSKWVLENGRMAVRDDIANMDAYKENEFLSAATKLAADTTGRDTYPGYQIVSSFVQEMTSLILEGTPAQEALEEYHEALVDEFGEENVMVIE
ncbi:multiple sugar transport system substrate-binding protein [Cohaesibacter sp. ES.047]|uniref:extracellular solute-binding protein n=1 Tax=Cohaesibacter sp. ES.047 TaxID=1798205 RepID=UPI000BB6F25B|nr:extracellular solute-binding protein [Cohaesibacter sp. ES.047]SNY92207.1 multiple sugar transport system substrate-binding protein [Cohaesibacter sp. ES.047]